MFKDLQKLTVSQGPIGGLMQQIELELGNTCLYHRLFFDYHYGLEGQYPIDSREQIDNAKKSLEFGQDFVASISWISWNGLLTKIYRHSSKACV